MASKISPRCWLPLLLCAFAAYSPLHASDGEPPRFSSTLDLIDHTMSFLPLHDLLIVGSTTPLWYPLAVARINEFARQFPCLTPASDPEELAAALESVVKLGMGRIKPRAFFPTCNHYKSLILITIPCGVAAFSLYLLGIMYISTCDTSKPKNNCAQQIADGHTMIYMALGANIIALAGTVPPFYLEAQYSCALHRWKNLLKELKKQVLGVSISTATEPSSTEPINEICMVSIDEDIASPTLTNFAPLRLRQQILLAALSPSLAGDICRDGKGILELHKGMNRCAAQIVLELKYGYSSHKLTPAQARAVLTTIGVPLQENQDGE